MVAVQDELSKAKEAEHDADYDTIEEATKVHKHSTLFRRSAFTPPRLHALTRRPPQLTRSTPQRLHANQKSFILQAQHNDIESQLHECEAEVQRLGRAKSDVIAANEGNTRLHTLKHTHT